MRVLARDGDKRMYRGHQLVDRRTHVGGALLYTAYTENLTATNPSGHWNKLEWTLKILPYI